MYANSKEKRINHNWILKRRWSFEWCLKIVGDWDHKELYLTSRRISIISCVKHRFRQNKEKTYSFYHPVWAQKLKNHLNIPKLSLKYKRSRPYIPKKWRSNQGIVIVLWLPFIHWPWIRRSLSVKIHKH